MKYLYKYVNKFYDFLLGKRKQTIYPAKDINIFLSGKRKGAIRKQAAIWNASLGDSLILNEYKEEPNELSYQDKFLHPPQKTAHVKIEATSC